mmetsp:Transcript_72091/g.211213  ORF Transcript_72091/g.211213 Transcript_72091/m.211213 type:complete len:125 (-) Transcript_72091:53-427(-)
MGEVLPTVLGEQVLVGTLGILPVVEVVRSSSSSSSKNKGKMAVPPACKLPERTPCMDFDDYVYDSSSSSRDLSSRVGSGSGNRGSSMIGHAGGDQERGVEDESIPAVMAGPIGRALRSLRSKRN